MKVDSLSDFPILGLGNLSPEDEKVLGKFLHDWIVTVHGEDDPRRSGPQKRELEEAVRPLLEARARKDLPITITILDSDQVNAFSHIGGYIYLTRGLLGIARGNADYLFVVGGELAHLDLKHAEKTVAETTPAGSLRHLYHQIAEGYSEARVFEADDWVVGRMVKLDQTQLDCLSFLRKLANYAAENGFAEGNVRPKTGLNDGKQDIDNQIRADPAASRRVTRISERFFKTTASAPSPASATPPR